MYYPLGLSKTELIHVWNQNGHKTDNQVVLLFLNLFFIFHAFFSLFPFSFFFLFLYEDIFLFILFSVLFFSSLFSDILSFLLLQISSSLPFILFFIISYLFLYIPELIHMMNRLVPIHNAILKETKMWSIKREIAIESFLVFSPHSSPLRHKILQSKAYTPFCSWHHER